MFGNRGGFLMGLIINLDLEGFVQSVCKLMCLPTSHALVVSGT